MIIYYYERLFMLIMEDAFEEYSDEIRDALKNYSK